MDHGSNPYSTHLKTMKLIAHRGNLRGSNLEKENNPDYVNEALQQGCDAEIDVWYVNGELLLGHDYAQYKIKKSFLQNKKLWCHAKNLAALEYMINNNIVNFFWHENDSHTLTSSGYIWTYPNKQVNDKSIIVDLSNEWKNKNYQCYGVCVDLI